VLYPWHPWLGQVIYIHEAAEERGGRVFHCDLENRPNARRLTVPAWMFDRAVCLRVRRAEGPRVELAALVRLRTLLAEVANRASVAGAVIGARHWLRPSRKCRCRARIVSYQLSNSICSAPPSPQRLNWLGLSAEVREKVTRLIARMLSQHEPGNLPARRDGGGDDE